MSSLLASLNSRIGFLVGSLNKSNYEPVLRELSLLAECGTTESCIVLYNCLGQVNSREGGIQNLQLKHELLSVLMRYLVHQPNFSTIFSEALRHIPFNEALLEDLMKCLELSLPEKIGLGLALTDAEDANWSQEGYKLSKLKILELFQNPVSGASEAIIYQILVFLYKSEGLAKHVTTFTKILSVLNPDAQSSLLLMPLLCEETNVINCVRDADNSSAASRDLLQQLDNPTEVADFLEELGYTCTIDVQHCSEILSLFLPLDENAIARIIGMVSRTHSGLDDCHGMHTTFNTVFCNNTSGDGSCLTAWNVDVLLMSIKEMVPSIKWKSVVVNLDHEGFYLPDEESFNLLMAIYRKACEDLFPIEIVCGDVWKNREGQISLLKYAVFASPELLTFTKSPIQQMPLDDQHALFTGNQNQAWLSLDLLKTLFKLADMGHTNTVRSILEHPQKHYPQALILGIAQVNTPANSLQFEIFNSIFQIYVSGHQDSAIVLHHLWAQNPEIMMRGMLELHLNDATSIPKILEVCKDLKALSTILDAIPFSFSIELAALASRREYLNFENWLHENLSVHRDIFFQECLTFLKERALAEPRADMSPSSLPLETTATLFKVLQSHSSIVVSRDLLEEMKRVHTAAVRINPRLLSVGASEQSSESFATDVEEEANSYFQRIYVGQLTIENVVTMLECFKESPVKREQDIFACMIQCLFDEYRFFPRYPERELKITALLFGSLIKHQLVSSLTLGAALRYVLDALRKPLDSKMFLFGLTALGKFLDRLVEWPQYCNHILQISHIREAHGDLVDFIERALVRISASQLEQSAILVEHHHNAVGQILPLSTSSIETVEASGSLSKSVLGITDSVQQQQQQIQPLLPDLSEEKSRSEMVPLVSVKSASLVQSSSLQHSSAQLLEFGSGQKDKLGLGHANQANPASISSPFIRSSRLPGVTSRQPTSMTGFGHALNIETLIAAAERRDIPIEAPSSEVQDKVAFIINNISTANIDVKAREFSEVLKEQYYPWFAQYMVMKRASIEPNFHESYLKFLDKINSKALHKEIVKATYENCKVLLGSELIKSSSEERSLLKNLGSWLGKLTIGRNQALRAREIDPKVLITEAYERGLMIAVIPFTSKILEPCQSSVAYQPPNPWTMGILGLLAEIYALPNLKMNLKFDIEVLFKNLGVDMKDVKPTQLLKGRPREVEGNPDFSNKDIAMAHQSLAAPATESNSTSVNQVDSFPEVSVSPTRSAAVHTSQILQQLVPTLNISSGLTQSEEEKTTLMPASERVMVGQVLSQSSPSPSAYSTSQLSMAIPNLSTYVVINSKLATFGQQLQLSRIVPLAMEHAIREIIYPVVDRSVTIACMTTRELVTKDYAMEADENRIRHSANLMVASLAGSLAHVTCKEPLRLAMANHIKNLLQTMNISGDVLDQAVLLVTNDNLDLGCAVIEKAATEKALRDLEEAIGSALTVRRKQREAVTPPLYDATIYNQENLARLPEQLRPKPGRLSNVQQRVYEDFARLPWQNQPTQPTSAQSVALSGPLSIPLVSGLGRVGYTPSMGQSLGSYAASGGNQSGIGIGSMVQPVDVSLHDFDDRLASPLSLTSSAGSVVLVDSGARQMLETAMGLGNFSAVSRGTIEGGSSDVALTAKDAVILTASASPPLPSEQVGALCTEPVLSTVEAMEKYHALMQKLDAALSKGLSLGYTSLSQDKEIEALVSEIPEILTRCITKEEAAISIAQKELTRLYEDSSSTLHMSTHLTILAGVRDICRRIVKDLTSWVIFSDDERKLNHDVILGLIRYELIHLPDYSLHLTKLIDGGRNAAAMEFAIYLVKTCVVQGAGVNAAELYNIVDALEKVAQRPGSPESLQQLVEIAKNSSLSASIQTTGRDDKLRQIQEKRDQSANSSGVIRDDNKIGSRDSPSFDAVAFREQVALLFDEWARICDGPGVNEKGYTVFMSQLQQSGMLKGDDVSDHFFRVLTEIAVSHALNMETSVAGSITITALQQGMTFTAIDIYTRLVVLLVKYYAVDLSMSKVNLINRVLTVTVRVIQRDSDEKRTSFHPRPYFRLFVTWLTEFTSPDPALDGSNFQVLTAFASAFMQLQPLRVPGWSFAWLELVSHRTFMPKVLLSNAQKGWPLMQRLLVALFKFMEPYLRNADLSDPVRLLYKGTLRVLLVLLHDFPEFLCDYHFSFCDVIPPSCIQMRNLILSAFPRNMRLPDPFTPNLKVDLLPEISQSPRILSDVEFSLKNKQLKSEVDDYLKTRQPLSLVLVDLKQWLLLPQHEAVSAGTRYNVPLINSLVLYVGMQAIQQLQSKTSQQLAVPTTPITHSAPMDIFQRLIVELDTEGRYLFLNAIANQLRYPNNHTHYFSCVLLYLFAEANQEIIQEQITRVLLERLIVNRPHPWGLLITFIELIKNPRYNFWSHGFTRCAPEIEKLFESVARSCMGPPPKAAEDDLPSAEGLKS